MTWFLVRAALVLAAGVAALFVPLGTPAASGIGWQGVLVVLVVSPFALTLVLSIQVVNPGSAATWQRPSWLLNPFSLRQPLQFFHFAGHFCLAQGVGTLLHFAFSTTPFSYELLAPAAMGIGALMGVRLTMVVFSGKVERAP